jgi:hypothetical protein
MSVEAGALRASARRHTRTQRPQIGGELQGDAALGVARQHEHVAIGVGEQGDDDIKRRRLDCVDGRLDVGELGRLVPLDRLVASDLTDALGGRA